MLLLQEEEAPELRRALGQTRERVELVDIDLQLSENHPEAELLPKVL
jgi:hypothetical protein